MVCIRRRFSLSLFLLFSSSLSLSLFVYPYICICNGIYVYVLAAFYVSFHGVCSLHGQVEEVVGAIVDIHICTDPSIQLEAQSLHSDWRCVLFSIQVCEPLSHISPTWRSTFLPAPFFRLLCRLLSSSRAVVSVVPFFTVFLHRI